MSASLVALVIFPVRADPINHHDAGPVGHRRFEAVRVALYIEHHDALRQEAGTGVAAANVLRRGPCRALDIRPPVLSPAAGLGMLAANPLEPLAIDYFHACPLIR